MHAVWEAAADPVSTDRIAGLVGALVDLKLLTTPLEHLRHERQSVEATIHVECRQDFFLAANFDPIASA